MSIELFRNCPCICMVFQCIDRNAAHLQRTGNADGTNILNTREYLHNMHPSLAALGKNARLHPLINSQGLEPEGVSEHLNTFLFRNPPPCPCGTKWSVRITSCSSDL